jgi:lipopolysaccharide export system protein LptC
MMQAGIRQNRLPGTIAESRLRMTLLSSVPHPDRHARRTFPVGRPNNDRMFRAAVRHSRRVRTLRFFVPLGVGLIGLVAMALATWLDPLRALARIPIDLGSLVVSGTKVTMQQPRLAGFTNDHRPYEFTARAAAQDLTNPDIVELQEVSASMEMQGDVTMQLSAHDGVYNTKTEILTLRQQILVSSTNGYQGRLTEAVIDTRRGTVVSDKPVEIKMLRGKLDANRLEVSSNGDVILFDRGVTMTLSLGDAIGAARTGSVR